MMIPVEQERYRAHTIRVFLDEDAENPREWTQLGIMACWHGCYELGDIQPEVSPEGYLRGLMVERERNVRGKWIDPELPSPDDVNAYLAKHYAMLPLILLDHSGLAMSTESAWPFNCPWDAGKVGWIVCDEEAARAEYGDEWQSKAIERLRAEVQTYSQWLSGEVYGFTVEGPWCDDSCWGFYDVGEAIDAARASVDVAVDEACERVMS